MESHDVKIFVPTSPCKLALPPHYSHLLFILFISFSSQPTLTTENPSYALPFLPTEVLSFPEGPIRPFACGGSRHYSCRCRLVPTMPPSSALASSQLPAWWLAVAGTKSLCFGMLANGIRSVSSTGPAAFLAAVVNIKMLSSRLMIILAAACTCHTSFLLCLEHLLGFLCLIFVQKFASAILRP